MRAAKISALFAMGMFVSTFMFTTFASSFAQAQGNNGQNSGGTQAPGGSGSGGSGGGGSGGGSSGGGSGGGSSSGSPVNIKENVCGGSGQLALGSTPDDCAPQDQTDSVNNLIVNVINLFSLIVGIIAVIMIIYGAFRYITSSGDAGNITTARNVIIYAFVGLVIVALAQIIVKFVLAKATNIPAT